MYGDARPLAGRRAVNPFADLPGTAVPGPLDRAAGPAAYRVTPGARSDRTPPPRASAHGVAALTAVAAGPERRHRLYQLIM